MRSWQEQARLLKIGQSRKIPCCGKSPSTYISNSAAGIRVGPCFRCGAKDFVPHTGLSFSERRAMRSTEADLVRDRKMHVGAVSFTLAPSEAHAWVLKSGITVEAAAQEFGFLWNETIQRVLIPVGDGHVGRSLLKGQPKYVSDTKTLWHRPAGPDGVHVLVEDVLSAIKIHRAGYGVTALMGTSQDPLKLLNLLTGAKLVIGWFDPDAAGVAGRKKAKKACSLLDAGFFGLTTSTDPKLVPLSTIRTLIQEIKEKACQSTSTSCAS